MIFSSANIQIFFGDQTDAVLPHELMAGDDQSYARINALGHRLGLSSLVFLKQTHSIDGHEVNQATPNFLAGDYLITNQPNLGLALFTADCLPLIIYDPTTRSVGIAHAGWRGAIAGIATRMINHMIDLYGSRPEDCIVYFGPTARACCYEVGNDFIAMHAANRLVSDALCMRNDRFYFDTIAYHKRLLFGAGINETHCITDYALCTICNHQFCSWRRQQTLQRQLTIVWLKG